MRRVDVIRTSASRPEHFMASDRSWRKRLHFSGELRWLMHEDPLDAAASEECLRYAEAQGYECMVAPERRGQSAALTRLWAAAGTDYVLSVEDDWFLLERIDLDRLCDLMDAHPDVNQVAFFKRHLLTHRGPFEKRSREVDGVWLTSGPSWAFTPALCRRAWIAERWADLGFNVHHKLNAQLKAGAPDPLTADWTDEHLGTYLLGKVGDWQPGDPRTGFYVQHLGVEQWSRRASEGVKGLAPYPHLQHPNLYYGNLFLRPEGVGR